MDDFWHFLLGSSLALQFIILLPILITAYLSSVQFDKLLEYQYKEHFSEWENDGEPIGAFWTPKSNLILKSSKVGHKCMKKWRKNKPSWISNEEANRTYHKFIVFENIQRYYTLIMIPSFMIYYYFF